jgi:hypothetical protein
MLEPYGQIPAAALSEPYCIGFLQMVGVHVASQSLEKGSGMQTAMAAFDDALTLFAPNQARDVAQMLSDIRAGRSPQNESYLLGRKDADAYMGWKLLNLAPQWQGEAALRRFFDRLRSLDPPSHTPPPATETPVQRLLPLPPLPKADPSPATPRWTPLTEPPSQSKPYSGKVSVDWGAWTIVGNDLVRQYDFQNLPFAEKLMVQIRIAVKMGDFGVAHSHPHLIVQPPISREREIKRTVLCDPEDGSVEVGPLEVTIANVSGDASMFWFFGENSRKFLTVLYAMKRLRFILMEPDGKEIQFALPLHNDPTYRTEFRRIQDRVTSAGGPAAGNDDDAKLTKLVENNILIANEHAEIMRNKTEAEAAAYLRSIFDMYDVVWGVWNDPHAGPGMFPLKGDAVLRQAMASGGLVTLKMSAVLCSAEDGMAAQRRERG